jgi:hypothetical protein
MRKVYRQASALTELARARVGMRPEANGDLDAEPDVSRVVITRF